MTTFSPAATAALNTIIANGVEFFSVRGYNTAAGRVYIAVVFTVEGRSYYRVDNDGLAALSHDEANAVYVEDMSRALTVMCYNVDGVALNADIDDITR